MTIMLLVSNEDITEWSRLAFGGYVIDSTSFLKYIHANCALENKLLVYLRTVDSHAHVESGSRHKVQICHLWSYHRRCWEEQTFLQRRENSHNLFSWKTLSWHLKIEHFLRNFH